LQWSILQRCINFLNSTFFWSDPIELRRQNPFRPVLS
jgi:hypothetical protein